MMQNCYNQCYRKLKRYGVVKETESEILIGTPNNYIRVILTNTVPLPNYNLDLDLWDYPISEVDYLLDQIKDGDRTNGYTFLLWAGRLYETEQD